MPYTFTTRSNGPGNTIDASHINDLQTAITRTAGRPVVLPVDSGFSWFNQGGSSVTTDANGNVVLTQPTGTTILRGRTRPIPGSTYTVTAKIIPAGYVSGSSYMGMFWSDGTKVVFAGMRSVSNIIAIEKWSTATSFSASYTAPAATANFTQDAIWMRVLDDGTNRKVQVSNNGDYWTTFHSVSNVDFLTATIIGYMYRNESGVTGDIVLASWEE